MSNPDVLKHEQPNAFRCFKNEPDMEKIMSGGKINIFLNVINFNYILFKDFRAFGNLKCLLPRNIVYRWAWEAVRKAIGPPIGMLFSDAIPIMNVGAQNNGKANIFLHKGFEELFTVKNVSVNNKKGYRDIGDVWREELEVPYLRNVVEKLMSDIRPLYTKLHAVVRHVLLEKYENVPGFTQNGLIPADLFG